jgi:hypothetical protein
MIVYFDESYDNDRHYLLYGALFVPPGSTLHQRIDHVRDAEDYKTEIKYNKCKYPRTLAIYKKVVDAFVEDTAYFRCVVVDQHRFDYTGFGTANDSSSLKQARAYKKFAEMLLHPYVQNLADSVLLTDELTRCRGDEFLERIRDRFNPPGGKRTFRHLAEVSSSLHQYQPLQVCDLLLGCVLNNLRPAQKWAKNAIRNYLCSRLMIPSFLLTNWKDVPLATAQDPGTKFNVWYWQARKRPR